MKNHLLLIATGALSITSANAAVVATEDFESYTGGPFTSSTSAPSLAGQSAWVNLAGDLKVRSDYPPTGIFEGNVAFNASPPIAPVNAIAYRNDGNSYLTATDTSLIIEMSVRGGRWSRAGVGYTDGGGTFSEGLYFGTSATGWQVVLGTVQVGSSTDGSVVDEAFDNRLTVDLVNETAVFEYKAAGGSWTTPTGMGSISLSAMDTGASNALNPLNWNSLYIRTLGASPGTVDNIVVSAIPEPSSVALLGLGGLALILRRRK